MGRNLLMTDPQNLNQILQPDWRLYEQIWADVTFLYAERVDGPVARVDDAVLLAGGHDGAVHGEAGVFGNVQLPAELSDEGQTHRSHLSDRGGRGEERLRGRCVVDAEQKGIIVTMQGRDREHKGGKWGGCNLPLGVHVVLKRH